jgi:hypothetical protein
MKGGGLCRPNSVEGDGNLRDENVEWRVAILRLPPHAPW